MHSLRQRLARQEGFTLIELLIVMIIIGILLAIAVPSYLGFKQRANDRAAQSDVREALPSAEALYSDTGNYDSLSITALKSVDSGLASAVDYATGTGTSPGTQAYCIGATVGGRSWSASGPGATWFQSDDCSGTAVTISS